jgi:hypothetical protein
MTLLLLRVLRPSAFSSSRSEGFLKTLKRRRRSLRLLMTCRINKEKEIVVDEKGGKLVFSNS